MKRVKTFAILSVFLATVVFQLAPAQAVGVYEKYIEWYADATKTEVVGWRHQYCDGTVEAEGYVTAYKNVWWLGECDLCCEVCSSFCTCCL